jgi:transposase
MSRKRTEIASPEREKVQQLLNTTTDPRQRERLLAARMAMTGQYTLAMIAECVGRARSVIQTWLDNFEQGGVAALLERKSPPGRTPALSSEVQAQVTAKLREGAWRTAGQFRQWLKAEHHLTLSVAGSYYWLGKSQGVLKAPRPCHRQQKSGAVEEFKTEGWEQKLAELNLPPGEPVRFWVMDESRFGLHTMVRHCWGLRGARVVRPCQQKFDWDYVYGAISVLDGEPVFCHLPTVTCEAVWEFLRQIVQTQPEAHHVILWDGAGFHQPPPPDDPAWADLARVHPLKLPPYCPELNPTEKIWDQLKDVVCNRVFETIEVLRAALLPKLRSFWSDPLGLSSLVGRNWLLQKVNALYPVILPVSR